LSSRPGDVERFDDLPVNIGLKGHSRLLLSRQFKLIFNKYIQWSAATIREASPQQRPWSVMVGRDGHGHVVLGGAWREFALRYEIRPHSSLLFRNQEGTTDFVVKVFTDGCRISYPPAPAE
jgi:hypothetical protein